jgi:hypothetical protein
VEDVIAVVEHARGVHGALPLALAGFSLVVSLPREPVR